MRLRGDHHHQASDFLLTEPFHSDARTGSIRTEFLIEIEKTEQYTYDARILRAKPPQ